MNVRELRAALQDLPDDMEVVTGHWDGPTEVTRSTTGAEATHIYGGYVAGGASPGTELKFLIRVQR